MSYGYWFKLGATIVETFFEFVSNIISVESAKRLERNQVEQAEEAAKQLASEDPPETGNAERAAKSMTAVWLELQSWFPYVSTPEVTEYTARSIMAGVIDLLNSYTRIGWTRRFGKLPVPALPPNERRRHLWVIGRTGVGKSTLLESLIWNDLYNEERVGVGVVAPEGELFRERLIPMIPATRLDELVYFAPGDLNNQITFNPLSVEDGDDPARAAQDLFTIFKRTIGGDGMGPQMKPILQNAFALLTGKPGMTLMDVGRLLTDDAFREVTASEAEDEYVADFWLNTYPNYPSTAALPIISRLDQFIRPRELRQTLCSTESTLSIRDVLRDGKILFISLYGLSEENQLLMGSLIFGKFQIELMKRELGGGKKHKPFYLYADEFSDIGGTAEDTWRQLLKRGRKYGVGLTLAAQHPSQLPTGLRQEVFGNVNSIIAFSLAAADAATVSKELLRRDHSVQPPKLAPVPAVEIIDQGRGEVWARLGGGKAFEMHTPFPKKVDESIDVPARIAHSQELYGAKEVLEVDAKTEDESAEHVWFE